MEPTILLPEMYGIHLTSMEPTASATRSKLDEEGCLHREVSEICLMHWLKGRAGKVVQYPGKILGRTEGLGGSPGIEDTTQQGRQNRVVRDRMTIWITLMDRRHGSAITHQSGVRKRLVPARQSCKVRDEIRYPRHLGGVEIHSSLRTPSGEVGKTGIVNPSGRLPSSAGGNVCNLCRKSLRTEGLADRRQATRQSLAGSGKNSFDSEFWSRFHMSGSFLGMSTRSWVRGRNHIWLGQNGAMRITRAVG